MKMAKADDKDIDAAGELMSILDAISRGHYPAKEGEEDAPDHFDEWDGAHLRALYDRINETIDKSPGWPGRIIGGMCYVILYDKNEIVDPAADVIELHPKLQAALASQTELQALRKLEKAVLDAGLPTMIISGHQTHTALSAALADVNAARKDAQA